MSSNQPFRETRRSTRVPLRIVIDVRGSSEKLVCEGETIIVNLHGALISTPIPLSVGMRVVVHVYLTNKRAPARVVHIDPEQPLNCGIELDQPRNIWGVSLPPEDWNDSPEN
jgi:hypothetical protein